jgi:hypothetical protein
MNQTHNNPEIEALVAELNNPEQLVAYKAPYDNYHPALFPRILGGILVTCGNLVYGHAPSYLKFRSVEVIARVPYHSWSSAAFTLLTFFYRDEERAMRFSNISTFSRIAQENETMHVVVISQLAKNEEKAGLIRHTIIPMLFAFFYFMISYFMYLIRPRWSYELNYLFESHAFEQYNQFLELKGDTLKEKPITSAFLNWYGRNPINQYEFFQSVRNDELIHRNQSIQHIEAHGDVSRMWVIHTFLSIIVVFFAISVFF